MSRLLLADGGADRLAALLRRVLRLDPGAVVRLRGDGVPGAVGLWVTVLDVLVRVAISGQAPGDVTVPADDLAVACAGGGSDIELPAAADHRWTTALPGNPGWDLLDEVPAEVLHDLVAAGRRTFTEMAATAPLPERVGTALLDHAALTVSGAAGEVTVPLRVPQALVRLDLLAAHGAVAVEVGAGWYRLRTPIAEAYRRRGPSLQLTPTH